MYSAQLLDHFQNPRNAGEVPNPDAFAQVENPACGDILKLTLKVSDGHIREIRFLAKGCVAAIGCASAITDLVQGKTIDEARKLKREAVIERVGGLPEASAHASHLAIDTLASAIQNIKR